MSVGVGVGVGSATAGAAPAVRTAARSRMEGRWITFQCGTPLTLRALRRHWACHRLLIAHVHPPGVVALGVGLRANSKVPCAAAALSAVPLGGQPPPLRPARDRPAVAGDWLTVVAIWRLSAQGRSAWLPCDARDHCAKVTVRSGRRWIEPRTRTVVRRPGPPRPTAGRPRRR